MKKIFTSIIGCLSSLCLVAGALFSSVSVLAAELTPASSTNIQGHDYSYNWAFPVKSYLYPFGNQIVRVEAIDNKLVIETYNNQFELTGQKSIAFELPIWGGFYAGENYNYAVFGQNNPDEKDDREVIRIVKYTKDFQPAGSASLYGANTTVPFDAGSVQMDEKGNYLFIRTSHEMYKSSDGYNHQANLSIAVDTSGMKIADSFTKVWNSDNGYVSHSFNQYILAADNGDLIGLDHGDAHPRSISMFIYPQGATKGSVSSTCKQVDLVSFSGNTGDNYTGAMLGGLTQSSNGYHVAYNYNLINSSRKVFYTWISKATLEKKTVFLNTGKETSNPFLVDTGNGGILLFSSALSSDSSLYYASYSDNGNLGEVKEETGNLSDCQPVVFNGKVTWYVTNHSTPVFYQLSDNGLETYQSGNQYHVSLSTLKNGTVSLNRETARAGNEVTIEVNPNPGYHLNFISVISPNDLVTSINQVSNNKFSFIMPDENVEVSVAFALDLNVPKGSSAITLPYQDVDLTNPYLMGIADLYGRGIMTGKSSEIFGPNDPLLRSDTCTILYRIAGQPATEFVHKFHDVVDGVYYSMPISWCSNNAITTGYETGFFGINDYVNKEQMITFLYRLIEGEPNIQLSDLSSYPDGSLVSGFARQAMGWADAIGLLNGETVINPQQVLTRSQVAYYTSNALRYLENN